MAAKKKPAGPKNTLPPPKHPKGRTPSVVDRLRPGPHVGGPSAADDFVPMQTFRRGQILRESARGRTEPRRFKTGSQRRRTQDAGGGRPTVARAKPLRSGSKAGRRDRG